MQKILPKDSNIRGVLLTDGRELIAKVEATTDGYMLENPVLMITRQLNDGSFNVYPMPFSLIMSEKVTFFKHAVTSVFPVNTDLEDGYLSFVSGIPLGKSLIQG